MTVIKIPVDRLNSDTLQGVIEEYVSRDGTDYGTNEVDVETKIIQVKRQLESNLAVLIYDTETQTSNIFPADDPVLRTLGSEN